MHALRPALALAFAGLAASGALAYAVDAPRNSATSKTLYLAQEGCGETAQPGRLELKPQSDSADGCGTIGGLPVDEAFYQLIGPSYEDFTSTSKLAPVVLDHSKKVTGQVTGGSWIGFGVGAGDVAFDVHLVGRTKDGRSVDFGETSVSTTHSPGAELAHVPFTLTIPSSAKGKTFTRFVLSVAMHGANVGMSSKQFSGESYVTLPLKKK